MGDESVTISDPFLHIVTSSLPPGGARGVLPATETSFNGELMFIWSSPIGGAAAEERRARGDEDETFWRAARGVPCDRDFCDRREAGEDIVAYECQRLLEEEKIVRTRLKFGKTRLGPRTRKVVLGALDLLVQQMTDRLGYNLYILTPSAASMESL